MSSLPPAHVSEEPSLPEGVQPLEISDPIVDLDKATSPKMAKEILDAIAKVENIQDEFGVLYTDHPIVQHYLKTSSRLRDQEKDKAKMAQSKETRHEVKQVVRPKGQAEKKDSVAIPVAGLHTFGLFKDKTGSVTEAEAVQAAKTLKGQIRIDALQAIPDLISQEKQRLVTEKAKEKKNSLLKKIEELVSEVKGISNFDDLRSLERQISEKEDPAVSRDLELIKVLGQRKKMLGDLIRQFDAIAKLPNSTRFFLIPEGSNQSFNYAIEYAIGKHDKNRILIAQIAAERPDAPQIDVDTVNFHDYDNLPDELKRYVFGKDVKGIFLRGGQLKQPQKPSVAKKPEASKPAAPKAKPQHKPAPVAKPFIGPKQPEAVKKMSAEEAADLLVEAAIGINSNPSKETKTLSDAINANPELKIVRDALYALADKEPEKILPGMVMEQLEIIVRKAIGMLDPDLGDQKGVETPKGLRALVELGVTPSALGSLARDLNKLIDEEAKMTQRKAA